jgi:phosphatidate phosphatase LPIN
MPLLGRDWSHAGVTKLYSDIAHNGFQLVYLTSRAIGQANITRSYIRGLKQDGLYLPEAPILMSSDRLLASFRREVIDRQPQLFKILALTQLKHLFPPHHNPFYAGFGNRITDVVRLKLLHHSCCCMVSQSGQMLILLCFCLSHSLLTRRSEFH